MLIKYKWIHFSLVHDTGKTKVYDCYNTEYNSLLGQVKWYGGFRKYSFFPKENIVFETQCLKDITSFLDQLTLQRKLITQTTNNEE